MNLSTLTFRDLEYLVKLAELRHFGKAAKACAVSQPALSTQVHKFEERLGIRIFDRNNRSVSVSPDGVKIIEEARQLLELGSRLVDTARSAAEPLTTDFRLGVIASLGPYLMPVLIRPLLSKFPKVRLKIREGLTHEIIEELRNGQLDAVLASPTFKANDLVEKKLFYEPFFALLPKGHRLLSQSTIAKDQLNPSEMILLEDGHCLKDQILDFCPHPRGNKGPKTGLPLQSQALLKSAGKSVSQSGSQSSQGTTLHMMSLETVRSMIAVGAGYSLFPELALRSKTTLDPLIEMRPISGGKVGRDICLYFRKNAASSLDAKTFGEWVLSLVPKFITSSN